MIYKLDGRVKDPADPRDYPIEKLLEKVACLAPLPEEYMCIPNPIVLDQGGTSECVAFAAAGCKDTQQRRQFKNWDWKLDPHDFYKRCKQIDGIANIPGTYPRVACGIMKKEGYYRLVAGPSVMEKSLKITDYYSIKEGDRDESIKQVLIQFGPFMVASAWYDSWMLKFNVFPKPDQPGGGHCTRIEGWTPQGWLYVNSWGKANWGKGGMAVMPYDMFRSVVLPEADCWKLVDDLSDTNEEKPWWPPFPSDW